MRVDDRVSLKTVHFRTGELGYYAQAVRFGASDAVALESIIYSIEGLPLVNNLQALALSRNPDHLLNPPDEVAEWATDEALYARGYFIQTVGDQTGMTVYNTFQIFLHGIVVPSRQIMVHIDLTSSYFGIVAEIYFREAKLSRAEADLLNITWGKYRR